jgi:hypothetical protein
MRNRSIISLVGLALVVTSASQASAQRGRIYSRDSDRDYDRPIELGVDAGVSFGLDEPSVTTIGIPIRSFRVGFFFTDNVSLEPSFGLSSIHVEDETFTQYEAAIALLLHLSRYRPASSIYVRPFVGVTGVSGGGDSDSNGFAGAGLGVKLPWGNRRLATRLEANFTHGFDGDGTNAIGLLAGISVFIR